MKRIWTTVLISSLIIFGLVGVFFAFAAFDLALTGNDSDEPLYADEVGVAINTAVAAIALAIALLAGVVLIRLRRERPGRARRG